MYDILVMDTTKKPMGVIGFMSFLVVPREGDWIEVLSDYDTEIYGVVTVCHTTEDSIELYVTYLGSKSDAIDMYCPESPSTFPI